MCCWRSSSSPRATSGGSGRSGGSGPAPAGATRPRSRSPSSARAIRSSVSGTYRASCPRWVVESRSRVR
ncbi:hypothetical protein DLJ46_28460 [Micromonospora globispora]|uniref:Uncharacterized protein n=1 Tax=Micromonospora globispora TaxID=1450148 RepID=A0A317JTN0_9ACTN|nr:hypothetical protein DLJ46_28460 [Micromonospora globispora]